MSSEELILLLDSLQPRLPKCANAVLLRLVAKCITSGTNEVDISAAVLARELGMSEDSVKVAKRALDPIIPTRVSRGISTLWTLPADWFVLQRSLFAVDSPVENWDNRPGNQGTKTPGNQGTVPQLPGHTALETRAQWTSFQGTAPQLPGHQTPGNQGTHTQNQHDSGITVLETRALSIDRDRVLSSVEPVLLLRDSIEGVNWLPEELRDQGEQLKRWLRFFFTQARPSQPVPDGPDEIIQAKCLAIAPLTRLNHVIKQLHAKHTSIGDTWAWWVTVFSQRIHGTKNLAAVKAPAGFHVQKKTPSSEGRADFTNDLLQEVAAGVGRLDFRN